MSFLGTFGIFRPELLLHGVLSFWGAAYSYFNVGPFFGLFRGLFSRSIKNSGLRRVLFYVAGSNRLSLLHYNAGNNLALGRVSRIHFFLKFSNYLLNSGSAVANIIFRGNAYKLLIPVYGRF